MDTSAQCVRARWTRSGQEKHNTFHDLCLRAQGLGPDFAHWDAMRNNLDLAGYFLFLSCCIQAGCVIILCQFTETGLLHKQVTLALEQMQQLSKKNSKSWRQVSLLAWF